MTSRARKADGLGVFLGCAVGFRWSPTSAGLMLGCSWRRHVVSHDKCSVIQSDGKNGSMSQPNGKDGSAAIHADRS